MVKRVKVPQNLIAGDADEGYGQIADVFRRTMTSGQEIGAAVAVTAMARRLSTCGVATATAPRRSRGGKTQW